MTPQLVVTCARDPDPGAAHALLLREVAAMTHTTIDDWRLTHHCGACGSSEHGRPIVRRQVGTLPSHPSAVHVSVARAGGLVVVAVTSVGAVGVDLEAHGAVDDVTYDRVGRHPGEDPRSDATVSWVRKESILKAAGHGLAVDPRLLRVSGTVSRAELLSWPVDVPAAGPLTVADLDVAEGFVAAVTVCAPSLPALEVRRAAAAAREG